MRTKDGGEGGTKVTKAGEGARCAVSEEEGAGVNYF